MTAVGVFGTIVFIIPVVAAIWWDRYRAHAQEQ